MVVPRSLPPKSGWFKLETPSQMHYEQAYTEADGKGTPFQVSKKFTICRYSLMFLVGYVD